ERGDEEECGADVAGEQGVERLDFEVRRCAEPGEPGVVDQDVNLAHSLDQALEIGWIAEVGADEARLAARGGNRVDSLGASGGVAAMDDDLGAVAGQLQGYCTADAGRRARHEGLLTLEVTGLGRGHCCSPKVVVHKPLGAHNSAVSMMVPDHGNSQKATPSESSSGVARFSDSLRLPDEFPGRSYAPEPAPCRFAGCRGPYLGSLHPTATLFSFSWSASSRSGSRSRARPPCSR